MRDLLCCLYRLCSYNNLNTQEEILFILGRDMVLKYLKCYSNISTSDMFILLGIQLYLIFFFYLNLHTF